MGMGISSSTNSEPGSVAVTALAKTVFSAMRSLERIVALLS